MTSGANGRIDNFKKPLDRFYNRPDVLSYKWGEVDAFARDLTLLLTNDLAPIVSQYDVALVPLNTSRPRDDQFHDTRLIRLCEKTSDLLNGIVRVADVMCSKHIIQPSHTGGPRDLDALRDNLQFSGFGNRVPDVTILVDDVLVKGTHYAVCRDAIHEAYPDVLVIGAFLSLHRSDYVDYKSYGIEYQT